MKDKIVIIGSGASGLAAQLELKNIGHNDVILMTPDQAKQDLAFPKSEPFIIHALPPLIDPYGGKEFVCKGKHQYRENNGKWICQCGRVL